MVVNNKLFPIISIFILVIGVILSAVGITLIIVSSTTECTPVDSPSTVSTTLITEEFSSITEDLSSVSPPICPPQTCHSTMFGAQVPVAGYKFIPELEDPTSPEFQQVSQTVSNQIKNALEETPNGKMQILMSSDAIVTYDVQVTRFTPDDKGGTIAYTSGVAVSTAPVDEMPKVKDIQTTLDNNLPPDTPVIVKEPSNECPDCSCQTVVIPECPLITTSTDCPTVIPTDSLDCSHCPISTECPFIPCPTTSLPNSTECPTVIPTECPICPQEGMTTECPSIPCPTSTSTPCDCPSTDCPPVSECPSISTTNCPMVIPTECPVCPPETISTECPLITCPTSSPIEWANATDCPTIIPTDCPVTECPICPSEVTCPSVTPPNTRECPVATECPTIIPIDCSTVTSSDAPQDCSACPPQFTECPVASTTECPTLQSTECPTVIPTDCPIQDCSSCPSITSSSPVDCVTSTVNTTDCPSPDCSLCSTDLSTSFPSSSCPTISPTECNCPSSDSTSSTDCPTTDIPFSPTCHSTIFGAQLSLVETPWDTKLNDPDSDEFKEKADEVSKMLLNALDGSMNEMIILSSGDAKVTYNVQVDRFSPGSGGTIAYASGVALSIAPIEEMPSVSDIRNTLNSSLGEEVTVENNELQFCSSDLFPSLPCDATTLSMETTEDKTTQSKVPHSTSQKSDTTQTTPSVQRSTTEDTETTHPSTPIPQSSSLEPHTTESTPSIPQTTTQKIETTQSSTTFTQSTSQESVTTQSTPSAQKSTTEGSQSTEPSTPISQSSTDGSQTTHLSSPVPPSTTEVVETTQPSSPSTSNEPQITQSTSHTSEPTISTTEEVIQSSTEQKETTQFTTPMPSSSSQEPSHSSTFHSTTEGDHTTEQSSPSPSDISTTEELNGSSPQSQTESSEKTSPLFTTSSFSTEPSQSTFETTSEDISTISTESLLSTTEGHSSSPSLSTQSILPTTAIDQSSTLPSQTTIEQLTVVSTEALTTLPSTSQVWTNPSTVSCSGREVINGDVYLLFDYTLYDGIPDETTGIEDFIADILFSFDGNHFFLGRDPINGAQPLRFYLVHYPTDDENPYSKMLTKDVTSLEQLRSVMDLIKQLPLATDSRMKEALDAIYTASNTNNPQSILLISKSDEFVDEAKTIAKQLQMDKKFNIIGVPLNGIDLTPLTNYDDIPLDVTSVDSQVETATNIDSLLMSISNVCLPSTPPPLTTIATFSTPSTTKMTTTISSSSCDPVLTQLSIAFVYQANGGIDDNPSLNSDIVNNILGDNRMKDPSSYAAFFPFPHTDGGVYSSSAAHTWMSLDYPTIQIIFNILSPSDKEVGATISDGLQSLIEHPDDTHNVINNIVVIIANSADDVTESRLLADQLKETSTIITLSYGGDFDLSSLASSQQFVLTQTNEDSTQAASLLLNSILQATCQ